MQPRKAKDVITTIALDADTLTALKHLAVDKGTTVRDLIRKAVAQLLAKEGR